MARITCDLYSDNLQSNTTVTVLLPTSNPDPQSPLRAKYDAGAKFPTLYLLHGMFGDHTDWTRFTQIETFAEECGAAVVMPSGANSFYTNMKHGPRYFSWVAEELPRAMRALFPLSEKREDNFIAGLSMGGYGAFKIAMTKPENYAAAASLSGAVDIVSLVRQNDEFPRGQIEDIFGDLEKVPGGENDLFALTDRLVRSAGPRPRFYQACGTEDFIYGFNLRFRDHAKAAGLDLTYEEGSGIHDFYFWNTFIKKAMTWMGLCRKNG